MQPECRLIEIRDSLGCVHNGQNHLDLPNMFRIQAARIVILEQLPQAFVPEVSDYHRINAQCKTSFYSRQ
jgi:hypothetical protein